MMVRARRHDHIARNFPGATISYRPDSQYAFETVIDEEAIQLFFASAIHADVNRPGSALAEPDYRRANEQVCQIASSIKPDTVLGVNQPESQSAMLH